MEKNSNNLINFVSETAKIGRNVKIWHFSYIGNNTKIGDNVSIGSLVHIDYNVKIGDNTRIEGSVYIPPLTTIGKNVFIGPCVAFTNDPYPMSPKMIGVVVEDGAIIGGRAVFKAGITVEKQCSSNGSGCNKRCTSKCCCNGSSGNDKIFKRRL
jgi:UDP-3-O-[3-hydroxymyristoyl] glucosamine N-acyltransferase